MLLCPARPSQHVVPAAPSSLFENEMKWINITYAFSSYLTDSRVFSLKRPFGEYCIGKHSFKTASYFQSNTIKQINRRYSHCLLWEPHGACKLYRHVKPYVLLSNLTLCVPTTYNKPTRYANFSNLFLEWNSTCFGQLLCPSSGVFSLYTQQWYMSYRFADSLRAGSGRNCSSVLILLASCQHIYHCCVYSEKTPDDGQRNCPKHTEFHSKNKFEKLVHLVGLL